MDESHYHYSDTQSLQLSSRKSKWLILAVIFFIFIIALGVVRAQLKKSEINKASIAFHNEMMPAVVGTINSINYNHGSPMNNIDPAQSNVTLSTTRIKLAESKQALQKTIDELKLTGAIHYKGNITQGSNATNVILASSMLARLSENLLDNLEENKFDLEIDIISDIQNKGEEEKAKKIAILRDHLVATSALTLSTFILAVHHAEIWSRWGVLLRLSSSEFDEQPSEKFKEFEMISQQKSLPTKEEIQALNLKRPCMDSLQKTEIYQRASGGMTVSKVLLFSGTINEICTYLEGYEKNESTQNA